MDISLLYKSPYNNFNMFLDKVRTSRNFDEIICLYNIFKESVSDETELDLIKSVINNKNLNKKIPVDKFCSFLRTVYMMKNKDNICELINDIKRTTLDQVQLNTIDRIISIVNIHTHLNDKTSKVANKIKKQCPHCQNDNIEYENTDYTICGYSSKGYDWKGCGFDWCFKCEKKLCKCWDLDELFNKVNRFHDKRCCKIHAQNTNQEYPDDYCQCKNMYVHRDQIL